ncbi:hypothetical protein CAEBREN_09291 [Caenorhabditis brenneri]|uniref:Uncharacterized protein n=1 Tax=Caenorhabditis brenneri TaxID=135651 RepID=G0M8X4_CAEBE|nr:hypothetical protein CAEBREN_09291 [Caenorhabditis brenneri]
MESFIIFAVFSGAFAQQLINLNTFTGEGQKNLIPGNPPYAIYVSAYPDSTAVLKSIYVFTGDGMVHRSLYDLKNNYFNQNSGVLQPFEVNTNAYLTTNLTTNDLKTLQGVMFITSTAQLNNNSAQGSTTSQYTTTGFYMKAKGQTDSLYTVHCRRDTKSSGTSGMNMIGSLPAGKKVTYGVYDGDSKWEESSVANSFFSPWSIPLIGENFQISSDGGNDAQYFLQYFTVQTVTSTTTAITTSGTSSTQSIITSTETATTSATTAMSTMSPTTTLGSSSTIAPSTSIAPTSGSVAVTSTIATTTSATSTSQNLVTSTKSATASTTTTTNTMSSTTLPGNSSTAAPTTSTILPTTFGGVTTTGNVETTTKSSGTTRLLLLFALISLIGL